LVSQTIKSLEVKEPYIVQTEMLKNRTHQSYRWVELALSEDEKQLEEWAKSNLHYTQEYRIKSRY
jgi:hypothetical protein